MSGREANEGVTALPVYVRFQILVTQNGFDELIYRIEYRAYPPFFSHFRLKGRKE